MYNVVEVITVAESVLRDKAKTFAKEIVLLCRQIKTTYKESVLTNQLLRYLFIRLANANKKPHPMRTNAQSGN